MFGSKGSGGLTQGFNLDVRPSVNPGPAVWPFTGGQASEFAPIWLEDSAQGFNPGNRPPATRSSTEGATDRTC